MTKMQAFGLTALVALLMSVPVELAMYLADSGELSKWAIPSVAFLIMALCWAAMFKIMKSLKPSNRTKRTTIWFVNFVIVWSMCIVFDVMNYSLQNNMLNRWYFIGIGLTFIYIGMVSGYWANMLSKQRKQIK